MNYVCICTFFIIAEILLAVVFGFLDTLSYLEDNFF